MMAKDKKKMQIEAKDSMLDILARSKAQTQNNNKTPKNKIELEKFLENDTLELFDDDKPKKAKVSDWKNIKFRKKYLSMPVELWSNTNIFSYFKKICGDKNETYKDLLDQYIPIARRDYFIKELFKKFEVYTGKKIDNVTLKQYLEYYVDHELEREVATSGKFSTYNVLSRKNIIKFNNIKTTENFMETDEIVGKSAQKYDTIDSVYETGGVNLLVKYGIVIPFVWLSAKKNLTHAEATKVIESFLKDASVEGPLVIETVKQMTNQLSPYPSQYLNVDLEKLMQKHKISHVTFESNGKMYIEE